MSVTDWVGSVGVFLILLAYFLSTINTVNNKSLLYIVLNLLGASLACYASILLDYTPFIILEAAWALVALVSLFKYRKKAVI